MNALKISRFIRGYNQARLGKEVGISATIISRLENDLYRNTPAVIKWKKKIAEILETPLESLFPGTPDSENGQ